MNLMDVHPKCIGLFENSEVELMDLPINDKELETIISALRFGGDMIIFPSSFIKNFGLMKEEKMMNDIFNETGKIGRVMDFLKEILKEIGDEYTRVARDIDDTEEICGHRFVHF